MSLTKNDVILFDGDSITDCGRDRTDKHSLSGYNALIAEQLGMSASCYNRGISGATSGYLLSVLEENLKEIKPTVYSTLIGVNDTWRRYDSNIVTTAAQFEANIAAIFKLVSAYTSRVVVLEPFLIPTNKDLLVFYDDLTPKIQVLRKYAAAYHAEYVPLDGIFAELSIQNTPALYSADGVHPTPAGNAVIAAEWLKRVH
jgi:lysophospholipase L1-like esterase